MYALNRYAPLSRYVARPARPTTWFADFDALARRVDALLHEDTRDDSTTVRAVGRAGFPALNVGVTAQTVDVYVFAAGIDAGSIEVTLDKGLLTLAGQRPAPRTTEGERITLRERSAGSFRREIRLPDDVDAEQVTATYRDGVLHVRIARREAVQPRRITVQGAASAAPTANEAH